MTIKEIQTEIDKTKTDIGNFIELYKTEHTAGRYENWNSKDVVAHILEWIIFSKNKLQAIAYNRQFEEVCDIDAFNRQAWIKNKDKHIGELKESIMFELDEYSKTVLLYSDCDLQKKDLPTGFSFELWRYMIMDTVTHPVLHMLYYMLKTKNYERFVLLCEKRHKTFYRYSNGSPDVYSFCDYIEDKTQFSQNIQTLASIYTNNDMIDIILKVNS
ncbi:hypothetical protein H0R92_05000 [Treponema sp. OMZ 840]|uniref:hypothetical protein n=1 Tax=Treponema sp. OMZ 840 TaxID=244313 RepID=UPI003D8E289F